MTTELLAYHIRNEKKKSLLWPIDDDREGTYRSDCILHNESEEEEEEEEQHHCKKKTQIR